MKGIKTGNATLMHGSLTSFGTASNSTNSYLYRSSTTNSWISMIANHLQEMGGKHWPSRLTTTCVLSSGKKQGVFDTFHTLCFSSASKFIFHRKTAVVSSALLLSKEHQCGGCPFFPVKCWTTTIPLTPILNQPLIIMDFSTV